MESIGRTFLLWKEVILGKDIPHQGVILYEPLRSTFTLHLGFSDLDKDLEIIWVLDYGSDNRGDMVPEIIVPTQYHEYIESNLS